jgi:hypothetical protein
LRREPDVIIGQRVAENSFFTGETLMMNTLS